MKTGSSIKQEARWVVEEDCLYLDTGQAHQSPGAEEIYASVFENNPATSGLEPGIPDYLDGLSFSQYPASLSLQIDFQLSSDNPSWLLCRVVAKYRCNPACSESGTVTNH